jgi:hypothetical protein
MVTILPKPETLSLVLEILKILIQKPMAAARIIFNEDKIDGIRFEI